MIRLEWVVSSKNLDSRPLLRRFPKRRNSQNVIVSLCYWPLSWLTECRSLNLTYLSLKEVDFVKDRVPGCLTACFLLALCNGCRSDKGTTDTTFRDGTAWLSDSWTNGIAGRYVMFVCTHLGDNPTRYVITSIWRHSTCLFLLNGCLDVISVFLLLFALFRAILRIPFTHNMAVNLL